MKRDLKLLLATAIVLAAAYAVYSFPQRINKPLPPVLNRLPEAKLVEIKDDSGQVILTGDFTTTSDTNTEIERTAALSGAGTSAKGKAEIELVKQGDGFSKQELEVALEGLAKSANFKLYVDGNEIIAFTANKPGKASLKFSSKNVKN
jgi:hypothetical protein